MEIDEFAKSMKSYMEEQLLLAEFNFREDVRRWRDSSWDTPTPKSPQFWLGEKLSRWGSKAGTWDSEYFRREP